MSSLLSAISGQFGKSLLLGTFFPVVIFVVLFYLLVLPFVPMGVEIFHPFEAIDKEWKVIATTFLTIVLTGLLYNLNTTVIRVCEGYPWQDSLVGRYCKRRQKARFNSTKGLLSRLEWLQGEMPDSTPREQSRKIQDGINTAARELSFDFPDREDLILPTRLGNIIRSFEVYPRVQYGMSAIELFPRLIAKVESGYAQAMEEPKTALDFMLNCSALSAVMAFLALFSGLSSRGFGWRAESLQWIACVIAFAMLSRFLYLGAIRPAQTWGQQVKGAFDMYRLSLLKQFGYDYVPADLTEERNMWKTINMQIVFPSANPLQLPYKQPTTRAITAPADVDIAVARGLGFVDTDGSTVVTLQVTNRDSAPARVAVIDTPPSGMTYLWDSLQATGVKVSLTGADPLRFQLGKVNPGQQVLLTYRAITPGTKKTTEEPK